MSGAVNTQASEFPPDGELPTIRDASEFRDIDLTDMVPGKTTEFASTLDVNLAKPVDSRAQAVEGRRVYANGPEAAVATVTSSDGARRYSAFTMTAPAGSSGYPGEPVLLLGEDASRNRILISHGDTSYIILGPREQVASGQGLFLSMGIVLETTVTEPIYVAVPVGAVNPIQVSVWAEYA